MQLLMHLGVNLILLVSLVGSASAFTAQALHVPAFMACRCKEGPEDSSSVTCMLREKRSGICERDFLFFLCHLASEQGETQGLSPEMHACAIFCI